MNEPTKAREGPEFDVGPLVEAYLRTTPGQLVYEPSFNRWCLGDVDLVAGMQVELFSSLCYLKGQELTNQWLPAMVQVTPVGWSLRIKGVRTSIPIHRDMQLRFARPGDTQPNHERK